MTGGRPTGFIVRTTVLLSLFLLVALPAQEEPETPPSAEVNAEEKETEAEGAPSVPDAPDSADRPPKTDEKADADADTETEGEANAEEGEMTEEGLFADDMPDDGFELSAEEMALLEEAAALEMEVTGETSVDLTAVEESGESGDIMDEEEIVEEPEDASPLRFGGHVGVEHQQFFKAPLDPRQENFNTSLVLNPELTYEWEGKRFRNVFNFEPFYRYDSSDNERSHFDVRELNLLTVGDNWNLRIGAGKVFWGATETVHWVDIINQTDLIESLDGEDKLGQPMVNLNLNSKIGNFSLFVLPYFRERTFPGADGRPRTIPRIVEDEPLYESSNEEWHTDFAVRWSETFGDLDIGLSYFYGTTREPIYVPEVRSEGVVLRPLYEIIHQAGLDATYTTGDWLLKLESVYRSGQDDEDFFMFAGGFEYTFYKVFGTQADVGLIGEMLYDTRGNNVLNPYENDLAAGLRLALNDIRDTEILFAAITDLRDGSTTLNLESSMRFGAHWKLVVEGRGFASIPKDDFPLNGFRNDHYLQVGLEYHF